ncbi:protoheme IX farnesyltransferase [Phototrophicus methaneseepsis]|uniref:Protoheme IX farnesyltransferase n=1 Tax=Phototrophicus methaneseepsis TaxID=2710758 RepID=A0A7S8ICN5_9CHLR|nr:heme o synthase [Phototrophicus methaneseepsis]QPC81735.1 protoheme IX farnesyltransferase [Phototrophicus methaneseepsis]
MDTLTRNTAPTKYKLLSSLRRMVHTYLELMKLRVVLLLVFTMVTAMVVASQQAALNPLSLISAIIGGTLTAGGASALNQFFDHKMDATMSRTSRRPIPSGRIKSTNAFLFGIGLLGWGSLVLMVGTNGLTAILAVIGALYYVIFYTLYLKRHTILNVIVGGGAGAFPVLVGWSAVAGTLSSGSLLLFLIVFFWTPPHSWALAYMVKSDYDRAEVPMLPVIYDERVTSFLMLWYSLLLVLLTLLPFPVGLLGGLYFGAAIVLGLRLIYLTLCFMSDTKKSLAKRLYKNSSMYLAILFLMMMLDVAIG